MKIANISTPCHGLSLRFYCWCEVVGRAGQSGDPSQASTVCDDVMFYLCWVQCPVLYNTALQLCTAVGVPSPVTTNITSSSRETALIKYK